MPTLSIVIPAYQEQQRLGPTLRAIRAWAARTGRSCQVVVVDDGSRDQTAALVRDGDWRPLDLLLLVNETNRGKGFAVRRGMLAAGGEVLLQCDADLSTPIEEFDRLAPMLEAGADIVLGSRDLPDSRLDPPQPRLRRVLAAAFRWLRRQLMLPHIRDTQCGFKLYRRAAAQAVFSRLCEDGWLFDCEALGLAERLGLRMREAGVHWQNHPASRVKPLREALRALPALLRIRARVRRLPQSR